MDKREPSDLDINQACMNYMHDFGLMSDIEKRRLKFIAKEWLYAWLKVDKREPSDLDINQACMNYMHDFGLMSEEDRKELINEAKKWLYAWGKENKKVKEETIMKNEKYNYITRNEKDNYGGLRKIADAPKPCLHPEHNPPSHIVLEAGTYEYVCPGCGAKTIFNVPFVTC